MSLSPPLDTMTAGGEGFSYISVVVSAEPSQRPKGPISISDGVIPFKGQVFVVTPFELLEYQRWTATARKKRPLS